jgi:hypothetical protein
LDRCFPAITKLVESGKISLVRSSVVAFHLRLTKALEKRNSPFICQE